MEKMKIEYPDESIKGSTSASGHSDDHAQIEDVKDEMVVAGRECAPLISVIVPIYNVEKYVRKCLESLKSQTMTQIEVICIDDGSTDSSGLIADGYENDGWPRFRVIHTENRGLSDARNRGIDEAEAGWIMFVDSDDWVDSWFCEIPYRAAIENNADLVIFNRYLTNEKGKIKREKKNNLKKGIINHETAIDIGWPAAWNKLYKKVLFTNICYPVGYAYEEVSVTHLLIYKASRIVNVPLPLYYYRTRRGGSITQDTSFDADWLKASKKRYVDLVNRGYPKLKARTELWRVALKCFGRAESEYCPAYVISEKYLQEIKGFPAGFSAKEKMMLAIYKIGGHLYRIAYLNAIKNCTNN